MRTNWTRYNFSTRFCMTKFFLNLVFSVIIGETCPGQTHECNDRGICFNGECYCYEGYDSDRCIPHAGDRKIFVFIKK